MHKDISEETLARLMKGVPTVFTNTMNETLSKDITEKKLHRAVNSMAKEKIPGLDGVRIEFFFKVWHTSRTDLNLMIRNTLMTNNYMRELPNGQFI